MEESNLSIKKRTTSFPPPPFPGSVSLFLSVVSFLPLFPSRKKRSENSLSSKVNASLWLCLNQSQGIKFLLKWRGQTSKRQANNEFKRKRWYKIHGCDSILLSLIIHHVTNALTKWSLYRLDETNTMLQPYRSTFREKRERERAFFSSRLKNTIARLAEPASIFNWIKYDAFKFNFHTHARWNKTL